MIEIAYTPPDELNISGTYSEMQTIVATLLKLSKGCATECIIESDFRSDPAPYEKALASIKALVTQGP